MLSIHLQNPQQYGANFFSNSYWTIHNRMMNSKCEKVSKMNYKYCMRKYCRQKKYCSKKKRKKNGCVTDSEDKILTQQFLIFKWKIKFIFCLSRKLILSCFNIEEFRNKIINCNRKLHIKFLATVTFNRFVFKRWIKIVWSYVLQPWLYVLPYKKENRTLSQ